MKQSHSVKNATPLTFALDALTQPEAEIQNVTGTAFVVAEFRADENAETHALYSDPVVPLFLNSRNEEGGGAHLRGLSSGQKDGQD